MRTTLRFNCGSIANQELFRFNKSLSALFIASISTIVIMWSSIKSHRLREKRDTDPFKQSETALLLSRNYFYLHQSKKLICLSLISVAAFIFILMFLFYFNNFYYLLSEVSYLQTQSVIKKIGNLGHMRVRKWKLGHEISRELGLGISGELWLGSGPPGLPGILPKTPFSCVPIYLTHVPLTLEHIFEISTAREARKRRT